MTIEVGTTVDNFELPDHKGEKVALGQLTGQKVLLSFYPLSFTDI